MSWLGDIFGAVTSPISSLVGAGLSFLGGSNANSAAKANADKQMQFQDQMSSTAYQRATKDMELAGLNPMLAYTQGGASTPSGASAPVQNVLSSAGDIARTTAELNNIRKMGDQIDSQTRLNEALMDKADADAQVGYANAQGVRYDNVSRANDAHAEQDIADNISPDTRRMIQLLKDVLGAGNSAKSLMAH